jgi:uncharacterized membrane protein
MIKTISIKLINHRLRLLVQLITGIFLLTLPIQLLTKLVIVCLGFQVTGLLIIFRKVMKLPPWRLRQLQSPHPKSIIIESLFYAIISFGLLVYLASSEHQPWHFALGFLTIICTWLMVQLLYMQECAILYYQDGTGFIFPDCIAPNWTEFFYQGFCIATCYQTSDTVINTTAMRQLIATQAILSYFLSISILGMMFGLVSNLL